VLIDNATIDFFFFSLEIFKHSYSNMTKINKRPYNSNIMQMQVRKEIFLDNFYILNLLVL
jgi:hypothetical protein